jgi:hypothetical protein
MVEFSDTTSSAYIADDMSSKLLFVSEVQRSNDLKYSCNLTLILHFKNLLYYSCNDYYNPGNMPLSCYWSSVRDSDLDSDLRVRDSDSDSDSKVGDSTTSLLCIIVYLYYLSLLTNWIAAHYSKYFDL